MGTNIGPMRLMEHWTEKDTPKLHQGKQSHWPIGGSGRAMSIDGMRKGIPGCDRDGIKRKVRAQSITAIKARDKARRDAYNRNRG